MSCHCVQVMAITQIPNKCGLYGRAARKKKPLIKKNHMQSQLSFTKMQLVRLKYYYLAATQNNVWQKSNTAYHPNITILTVNHGRGEILL